MNNNDSPPQLSSDAKNPNTAEAIHNLPPEILIDEIASRLDIPQRGNVKRVAMASRQSFSGPLPPPSMLGQYDDVQKGLADRIVKMAEQQQAHRHEMERKALQASVGIERNGQLYAFLISIFIIIGSIYLIATGHEISGSVLAGGTLTGLAYIFITGRKDAGISEAANQTDTSKKE